MLYAHVDMLLHHGYDAWAIHERVDFRPPWLEVDIPVTDGATFAPMSDDVLVVPEVLADDPRVQRAECRKVVFVQGSFTLLARHDVATTLRARGYECAMAVLPNVAEVVSGVAALPVKIVPPFVAPYFYVDPAGLDSPRPARLVIHAKPEVPDYPIVRALLDYAVVGRLPGMTSELAMEQLAKWEIIELGGLTHREVALTLAGTSIFVNLNCYEAFNTTVAEAMAAGAVPVCYEAYGPRDYLRNGENAIVFSNNSLFPLVQAIVDLMGFPDHQREAQLLPLRRRAHATASAYTRVNTEETLVAFFRELDRGREGRPA